MLYLMALIGIKGRVQTRTVEKEDEKTAYLTEMVAEKITFLSSKKETEKDIEVEE